MTAPPARRTGRPASAARRRSFLILAAATAASCARRAEEPPPFVAPLSWTHLTPLPLDVAALEIAPASPPPAPGDVGALLATPPAEAVRGMARDRLSAVGASGQAVFLVTAASLVRSGGGRSGALRCVLGCRLEVSGKGGEDGGGPGFVEASVEHEVSGPDAARPRAADLLLRRAMEDLNVEFEFRLRRNLRRWLAAAAPPGTAVPPAVGREELSPGSGGGGGGGPPRASEAGPLPPLPEAKE